MQPDKLKQLMEKRNAVNARIRREQNKLKAGERRDDTRRKILAGAAVLEWAAKDSDFAARLQGELRVFLVRDNDRALFGLPPVEKQDAPLEDERERQRA
ncbi:mobilization protein [Granulicella aggregans]|uniref:mobilization protein n=1 Tax=Granulicella aggregans TaxID=474949 RepID=UPI0021E0C445|nr:mobilization protein [Granulicella aggregans]